MTLDLSPDLQLALVALETEPTGPRVVAIGGGHGLAGALEAIRGYAADTTAIVSVADDGGSSGRLTTGLGIPAPGDIRRCLLALTPDPSVWSELFSYRFDDDSVLSSAALDIGGHSLGNLIIAALTDLVGDFATAVAWAGTLLGAVGRVVPASDRAVTLSASVDGVNVEGQVNIAVGRGPIQALAVGPHGVKAHPAAIDAIRSADQIVLGPGSLFTSVMAALVVPGIVEAVNASPASLVMVLNMVTEDGETLGLDGAAQLDALRTVGGVSKAGGIVVHEGHTLVAAPLEVVTISDADASMIGWNVARADLRDEGAQRAMHDPLKLGRTLAGLV